MRLLLFDIDGTLLRCGGQAGRAFLEALEEVYGSRGDTAGTRFAGRTDTSIVFDLLRDLDLERSEIERRLPEMKAAYGRRIDSGFFDPEQMTLLPGVLDLLCQLEARADIALGLLTGNWESGARAKLAAFDLNRFFSFGAFGDDGVERPELVAPALERANRFHARSFTADETLIVGDTRNDIACARAHGIAVLAVATGYTPAEELRAAGADRVLESLENLTADALMDLAWQSG